jgi:hypothetical protein
MFILVRTDGKYVAKPGSKNSYTSKLANARQFPTREAAESDRCPGNESIQETN